MADLETLYFDESGTPLLGVNGDGRLVVGGIAVRGDPAPIANAWDAAMPRGGRGAPKKGTRFDAVDLLDLADFLQQNNIVPVTSFSALDDNDRQNAEQKVRALAQIRGAGGRVKVSSAACFAWMHQVAQTLVPSILGSLPFVHGEMTDVDIAIDQFALPDWLQADADRLIHNWFDPDHRVAPLIEALELRLPGHPDLADLRANVRTSSATVKIRWTARGPLGALADAVAALYRRALQGDVAARPAWEVLTTRYRRDGRIPACMNHDVTRIMKDALAREWPLPR